MDIQNISNEDFDAMFGEVSTPIEQAQPQDDTQQIKDVNILQPRDGYGGLEEIDLEAFENSDNTEDIENESNDTPPASTEEAPKEAKPKKEKKDEVKETPDEVKNVLKNTVEYLVEKGLWKDFDGREDLELDENTYAELAAKQNEHTVQEMFSELLDSTGSYGKAIISHIKDGGNPDTIIDIFKEQKGIQAIDTSTDEGKLEKIGTYYSDVLGWKPERIKKHLGRIVADNDLESELADVDEQYDSYYQEQLERLNQERESQKELAQENKRRFISSINDTITELGYSEKDRKLIEKSLLTPRKLENGYVTTDFNLKFSELQKDPKKLIKLVEFVMDEANFINKLQAKANSKAAEKTFNFVKGNASTSKVKGSATIQTESNQNNNLDFSSLLKK